MRVPVRLGAQPLIVEDALFKRGYRPLGLQARPHPWGDVREYRDPVQFALRGGPVRFLSLGQEEIPLDQPAPGESSPQISIDLPPTETIVVPDFGSRGTTPPFVPSPTPIATGTSPSFFQPLLATLTAGAIAARTIQQIVSPPTTVPTATSPFFAPAFSGRAVPFGTGPGGVPVFPGAPVTGAFRLPAAAAPWYTQPAVLIAGGVGALILLLAISRR